MVKPYAIVCLAPLLFTSPAFAQQAPDPLVTDIANNWQAESVQHGNSGKAVQAIIEAYTKLKAENEKLKADLEKAQPKTEAN